jgi:O-antigen/teichoic acid export membrane protein
MAFTLSQYMVRSVDLFVLGIYAGAAATGIYAIAYQSYSVLQNLTIATGPVLVPLFVSLRDAGRHHVIERYYDRVIAQMTFAASVFVGFAAPLVGLTLPVLFGERFSDATVPLTILLLGVVAIWVGNLLAPIIVLHERTKAIGVINVVAAAVNVALDFLLVGAFGVGIEGPAIATVISTVVIMVGYAWVAADCIGAALPRKFPAMMLPAIAATGPCLASDDARGWILGTVAVIVASVIVLAVARPFSRADADLISGLDIPAPLKRFALRTLGVRG